MWEDPIVEEVRAVRTNFAARFGFDLRAIYNELKRLEKGSDRAFVSYSPRLVRDATSIAADGARG